MPHSCRNRHWQFNRWISSDRACGCLRRLAGLRRSASAASAFACSCSANSTSVLSSSVGQAFGRVSTSTTARGVDGISMCSLRERVENGEADIVLHDAAVHDIGQEHTDLEFQRGRAEIGEQHERFRVLQHQRMAARDLEQDRMHPLDIAAIGDADLDLDAAELVAVRPVADRIVDQVRSWAGSPTGAGTSRSRWRAR